MTRLAATIAGARRRSRASGASAPRRASTVHSAAACIHTATVGAERDAGMAPSAP